MNKNNPKIIIIHCSDVSVRTLYDQLSSIDSYHRDEREFPKSSLGYYVGYHRLITGGKNYQTRLDTDEGAHCNQQIGGLSINYQSLGICIGFDGDVEYPSVDQYDLLQKQIWEWQDKYSIMNDKVFFHRKFATGKTCPGSLLKDAWLSQLLTRPLPKVPTSTIPTQFCMAQEETIKSQNLVIQNLKNLLAMIINYYKK